MRTKSCVLRSNFLNRFVVSSTALLACVLFLTGCASSSNSGADFGWIDEGAVTEEALPSESFADEFDATIADNAVIRSGSLTLETDDPRATTEKIEAVAKSVGGHIESRTIEEDEANTTTAFLVVRVPDERLDEAFINLADIGKVTSETREELDVTLQKADLDARVQSLKGSINRLDELLTQAATVTELIELETARSDRQQDLDSLQAQLDALVDQIKYSTIYINVFDTGTVPDPSPNGFWEALLAGFASLATALSALLIGLGYLLPWLFVLTTIFLLVLLAVKLRGVRARRKAKNVSGGV